MVEENKMIEEVAKTTGKAIDTVNGLGKFISKYAAGSMEQGFGIIEDKLKYIRWERQLRLMNKAEEFGKSLGFEEPSRQIPLKIFIPLVQAATLEEDDYLQDLWAKLLINFSSENSKVDISRSYVDILERISPLEAKILEKIYSINFEEMQHQGVLTKDLPFKASLAVENIEESSPENIDVVLAISNLSRLGCLTTVRTFGGGEAFSVVNPTVLGKYFVEACTIKGYK